MEPDLGLLIYSTIKPGCGKGKHDVYCQAKSKKNGQLIGERPKLPGGNIWDEGGRVHGFLLVPVSLGSLSSPSASST